MSYMDKDNIIDDRLFEGFLDKVFKHLYLKPALKKSKKYRDSVKDLNAAIAKFEKSANDELKSLRKKGSKAKPVKIKRYKI